MYSSSHNYRFTIRQLGTNSQLLAAIVSIIESFVKSELGALRKHVQNMWLLRVHETYRVHTQKQDDG